MADTHVQTEVEDWVRREWMPKKFGQRFQRERLKPTSGGVFEFNAVSADKKIVSTISTSGSITASGKHGVGKMFKIRSDMYFLLLTQAERRIVILTERDMFIEWGKEIEKGRVPGTIEFMHVQIPRELDEKLRVSRGRASREVSPSKASS